MSYKILLAGFLILPGFAAWAAYENFNQSGIWLVWPRLLKDYV